MKSVIFPVELVENLRNNQGTNGYLLGKATKMYTLYSYNITDNVDDEGHLYETIIVAKFEKNVSETETKARRLYPGLPINEALHGITVSEKYAGRQEAEEERVRAIEDSCNRFTFGKYAGKRFNECNELGYLCWYYNNANFSNMKNISGKYSGQVFRANCIKRLQELDAVCFLGNYYDTPNAQVLSMMELVSEKIEKGLPFELTIPCGIDSYGTFPILDNFAGTFMWVKPSNYGTTAIPAPNNEESVMKVFNMKSKRVAHKKILVKDYYFDPINSACWSTYEYSKGGAHRATAHLLIYDFEVIK